MPKMKEQFHLENDHKELWFLYRESISFSMSKMILYVCWCKLSILELQSGIGRSKS